MNEILNRFNLDQRQNLRVDDLVTEVTPQVIRHISHPFKEGFISYSTLDENTVETAIAEQVAFYQELDYSFEWKVFDSDQPPDLKERLAAHGFEVGEAEALLILDVANAPAKLFEPSPVEIRRITDPALIPSDVIGLQTEVWAEDMSLIGDYISRELQQTPDEISIYVAYVKDKPVCSAWVRLPNGSAFGSLWGGSTLPDYRKRGIYSAILGVRVQEARQRGYPYLYIDASPMSRPILEKHGFQFHGYSYPCHWEPA